MKSIIEREATFENNSDIGVKETLTISSRTFVNDTQSSKICSTVNSTRQAKHRGGHNSLLGGHNFGLAIDIHMQFAHGLTCELLLKLSITVESILSWSLIGLQFQLSIRRSTVFVLKNYRAYVARPRPTILTVSHYRRLVTMPFSFTNLSPFLLRLCIVSNHLKCHLSLLNSSDPINLTVFNVSEPMVCCCLG